MEQELKKYTVLLFVNGRQRHGIQTKSDYKGNDEVTNLEPKGRQEREHRERRRTRAVPPCAVSSSALLLKNNTKYGSPSLILISSAF